MPIVRLFGQSAVGGIVSIITKRPEREFGGSAGVTLGSYNRKVGFADLTGPITDTLSFRLNGEIERSDTFVDFQELDCENASFPLTWTPSEAVSANIVTEWVERRTMHNPGLPVVGTIVSNGIAAIPRATNLGEPGLTTLEAFAPLVQTWVDIRLAENWILTPCHQATLFARYDVPDTALQLRTGVNDVGKRLFSNADVSVFPGLLASAMTQPRSVTVDIGVGYDFDIVRGDVTLTNVLDKRYFTRAMRAPAIAREKRARRSTPAKEPWRECSDLPSRQEAAWHRNRF